MKQLSGRMTGTEIDIEMQIMALRRRVDELEDAVRELRGSRKGLPPAQGSPRAGDDRRDGDDEVAR
jgi:hypothetical protein